MYLYQSAIKVNKIELIPYIGLFMRVQIVANPDFSVLE